MKTRIKFLITIIIIMFTPAISYAASGQLSAGDIEMECVYDNGVSISIYYENQSYGMSASNFKLANSITPPYTTAMTYFYNEAKFAKQILQSVSCPYSINYMVVEQKDAKGNSVTFELYYRADDEEYVACCDYPYDLNFFRSQIVAGFSPTSGAKVPFSIPKDSPLWNRTPLSLDEDPSTKTAFYFNLESERIYFNYDIEPKRSWAFKSEGQQAASRPQYIKVSEYVSEDGTTFQVAEKDKNITTVAIDLKDYDENYTQFVCFDPSVKNIKNDRNDMAYYFTNDKHHIMAAEPTTRLKATEVSTKAKDLFCYTRYSLYQEVSLDEYDENATTATSICDVIPDTALLISTFIILNAAALNILLYIARDIPLFFSGREAYTHIASSTSSVLLSASNNLSAYFSF